jgi:acyl dehydratase
MPRYCFEDLTPGLRLDFGPLTVSRDDIVGFAREFDPQGFHTDEAAAKDSFVGGLIASGWHTCALGMRLVADGFILQSSSMGSPGIEEVRWLRPVRPGDSLSMRMSVTESRPSGSKPDRGFVRFLLEIANGAGQPVMTQDFWAMFGKAGTPPLPPRPRPPEDPAPADLPEGEALPSVHLEDMPLNRPFDLGAHHFTRDDILRFARAFDPQPFHVDEAAAQETHFGGLCASGWHTAAAWMKRMVVARDRGRALAVERGHPVVEGGPSPGFRDLQWLKPVYAGDTIRYDVTLTEARASRTRPGWGVVSHTATGTNQRGEPVFRFAGAWLAPSRAG